MEEKSPLLQKEQETVEKPNYTKIEETYLGGLRRRMTSARDARDQTHDEFDGMSYIQNYELNERLANTYIQPKRNKEDTNFQSGIIRTKLFALLSAVTNLNLAGDVTAFDQDGLKVQALGNAMEDIILKTNELDHDDEKKFLRHYELLKHGTVFVEELWHDKKIKEKKMQGKFQGKVEKTWTEKIKKSYGCPTRNIIPGINVYLGDITKYDISEQPYIFTVDTVPYDEAKSVFGKWERWKNVSKKTVRFDNEKTSVGNKDWTLLETKENYVEIVRYQDKWNNEFALLLNGVLMTPPEFPLFELWGYQDYNVAQQNLEPINAKFAYGKSLVGRTRNKAALLDELSRVLVLKTQKSLVPPKFNLTGRVLSSRVFMPGKMNHGIDPRMILNADDKEVQGVTQAEFAMVKQIEESINSETVSPTFQGQQAEGNTTATEIVELQRQAKMVLGLTVFSVSMLEWKLEWLRFQNILAKWFKEEDSVVDQVKQELKSKYRTTSVDRPIEGEGMGRRIVVPTQDQYSPEAIMQAEDGLSEEQGYPVRLIFLNPQEVQSSKLTWQIVVRPKEKTTSDTQKLMFRAFMADAQAFGPLLNLGYLGEKFATVWQEDPKKLFNSPDQMQVNQMQQAQAGQMEEQGEMGAGSVTPGANLPTPEKAAGQQMKQQLQLS